LMAEKKYEYGLTEEDTRPGLSWSQPANLFYPYRREVIKAPVEERTRVDDRYVPSFTPGEYGEKEFGLKHMPFVRGIGSLYDFAGKFFSNPEVREEALTAAGKGIATLFEDQKQTALNAYFGGDIQYYDPEKDRIVNWDPFLVAGPAAVAGRLFPVAGGGFTTGMFAGVRAKTADLDKLDAAKEMEKAGDISRMEILRKTGWFRDNDNEWKFEISDKDAGLLIEPAGIKKADPVNIPLSDMTPAQLQAEFFVAEDILDHPEFFAAYPEFRRIPIRVLRDKPENITGTTASPQITHLAPEWMRGEDWPKFDPRGTQLEARGPYKSLLDTILHEFQHVIQFRENFAKGGTATGSVGDYTKALNSHIRTLYTNKKPDRARIKGLKGELNRIRDLRNTGAITEKDEIELYLRLSGEVEAWNVPRRRKMTAQQRLDKPAWETKKMPEVKAQEGRNVFGPHKEVSEEDLIVLKRHSGEAWTGRGNAAGGFIEKPLYDDQRMIG
jgi:hypothetical protein